MSWSSSALCSRKKQIKVVPGYVHTCGLRIDALMSHLRETHADGVKSRERRILRTVALEVESGLAKVSDTEMSKDSVEALV